MISIVLPYLSNSKCVKLCKDLLKSNTTNEYELIEIVDNTDVYEAYNYGALQAKYDTIVLINDDMFVSPGWDELFVKYTRPNTVITCYVIESGRIPVAKECIEYNAGNSIEKFDYEDFINFKNTLTYPEVRNDRGWFMPIAFHKSTFVEYPKENKYPYPNDIDLVKKILVDLGYEFLQVASYVYHLQNYSSVK